MKNLIITIITIFMTTFMAYCNEKSDAERYIADCKHCESVIITEFGNIQKFPYATERVQICGYFISKEALYVLKCTNDAFYAKNTNEAIKIIMECKDSVDRFKNTNMMPAPNTIKNLTLIAEDPVLYLDRNLNDCFDKNLKGYFFEMRNARKVTYILPNGHIETDVLIYKKDGRIQGLGMHFKDSVVRFFESCSNFYKQCGELYYDLANWMNGEYD